MVRAAAAARQSLRPSAEGSHGRILRGGTTGPGGERMAVKHLRQQLVGFGAGLAVGVVAILTAVPHAAPARAQSSAPPDELAALKADVDLLKQKATDQSHVMAD